MSLLTTAEEYDDPVRYKLQLLTPDEGLTKYTYDSFNTSNAPFVLTDIDVSLAGSSNTGTFSFRIDDTKDKVIRDTLECGYVAIIQGGKKSSQYKNIMIGIIDEVDDSYPIGEKIVYTMGGLGIGAILNYTILNFVKSANKEDILGSQPVLTDPKFRIDNLAIEAFTSQDLIPLRNGKTLQNRGKFNIDQLANSIKVITPSVNFPYATASAILESFAAASGTALWVSPNREIIMRPPTWKHSGVTIRPYEINPVTKQPVRFTDPAASTAYYYGGWSSKRIMRVGEFFNRIYLTINTDEVISSSPGDDTTSFTSLANKDLWQQFLPGSSKLFNLALMLSKTGSGRSPVDDAFDLKGVQGVVVKDDISNPNHPSNKIIARFLIPYDDIPETPTPIYNINLQYNVSNIESNALHWIGLFKRGNNEDSTIQWYHDSDFVTPSTLTIPRYSGTKTPFTAQPNPDTLDFNEGVNVDSAGPVHRYSFFGTAKTTIEVSDPISIAKYTPGRPIETRVNAPWISDVRTGIKYANTLLSYGAKLKRIFEKKAISIPTNLIMPLQVVNIVYPLAGIDENSNMIAEVNSVRYAASAHSERPFGSDTIELTATAYMNHSYKAMGESILC